MVGRWRYCKFIDLKLKIQIFPREINTSVPLEESGVEYIFDVFKAQNYSTLMSDDGIEWPMFTYPKGSHGWHRCNDVYDRAALENSWWKI